MVNLVVKIINKILTKYSNPFVQILTILVLSMFIKCKVFGESNLEYIAGLCSVGIIILIVLVLGILLKIRNKLNTAGFSEIKLYYIRKE